MLKRLGIILFIVAAFVLTALLFGYPVAGTNHATTDNYGGDLSAENGVH